MVSGVGYVSGHHRKRKISYVKEFKVAPNCLKTPFFTITSSSFEMVPDPIEYSFVYVIPFAEQTPIQVIGAFAIILYFLNC